MEGVIQALKRARSGAQPPILPSVLASGGHVRPDHPIEQVPDLPATFVPGTSHRLSARALRDRRIVAFDKTDPNSRSFDLLRNRAMAGTSADEPRVIAVASPTRGSGTSTTALNLAFGIARQRSWNVALIDMDAQSGTFEEFGLSGPHVRTMEFDGVALARTEVEGCSLIAGCFPVPSTFGTAKPRQDVLLWQWIQRAKRAFGPTIFVLDLPPLLGSDDGIPLALRADFLVLVLGVGSGTVADFDACRSSIAGIPHLVTLNKARRHGL